MSSDLRIFQWLGRAVFNEPSEGYYWAPSAKMLNPQPEANYLDGFPEGNTEVLPNTKGFVSFKYTNDLGQEMARTNFYKFVPIDLSNEGAFVQTVAEWGTRDCDEDDNRCSWLYRIAMPVNLYSEEVPLASFGKTPTMSVLEMAFGGNTVALADFKAGPSSSSSSSSSSNMTPLLLAGLGFTVGGPIGALAGLVLGSMGNGKTTKTETPVERPETPSFIPRGIGRG